MGVVQRLQKLGGGLGITSTQQNVQVHDWDLKDGCGRTDSRWSHADWTFYFLKNFQGLWRTWKCVYFSIRVHVGQLRSINLYWFIWTYVCLTHLVINLTLKYCGLFFHDVSWTFYLKWKSTDIFFPLLVTEEKIKGNSPTLHKNIFCFCK